MAGQSLQEIPLARIARVEILRGSQTARFGDQAVGGVVNIVTRQASEEPSLTAELAAGSSGWLLGRINHAQRRDRHELTLDAEFNHNDGWRDNSESEVKSVAAGWSHRFGSGAEVSGALSWVDQYGRFPGPLTTAQYHGDPRQSIYSGPFAAQYGSSQTTVRLDVSSRLELGGWGSLETPSSYQTRDLEWNMGPGYHADNLLQTLTVAPTLRQSGAGWSAAQGLELRYDWMDVTNYREMARLRASSYSDLERAVVSVFANGELEPWPDWHLNGALRAAWSRLDASSRSLRRPNDPKLNFSRSHEETNNAAQAGLRWEPSLETSAWLRYDLLYRLPSIDEIASYQGFALSQPFNDQLQAETGDNVELGAEWNPGRWQLKANVFAQFLDGEIVYDYVRNLNVNLADTRRLGGEVELGYRAECWSASVRYAGVDARFSDGPYEGNDIYLVPNHLLTSMLEYRPHRTLAIQLEHQWQSACYEGNDFTNTQPKLPAFDVMNLVLRYQPVEGLSCYLRVANLWDEDYATIKYSGLWYPAAGRQFQLGIRHAF
jgi:iron complex outermembrane receptor protein